MVRWRTIWRHPKPLRSAVRLGAVQDPPTEPEYWDKVEEEVEELTTPGGYLNVNGLLSPKESLELRDAYQNAGLTQQQAADIMDINRATLANALAGRYALGPAKIIAIKDFLKTPPPVVQPRLI